MTEFSSFPNNYFITFVTEGLIVIAVIVPNWSLSDWPVFMDQSIHVFVILALLNNLWKEWLHDFESLYEAENCFGAKIAILASIPSF